MARLTSHRPRPRRGSKAFTLVELLVVIGIIALLISILLPALGRARGQANSLKCLSNLRSIGQLINVYASTHKGVLPLGKWDGNGDPNKQTDWSYLLQAVVVKNSDGTSSTANRVSSVNARRLFADADTFESVGLAEGVDMLHYTSHPRLMPSINDDDKAKPLPYPKMKPYPLGGIRRSAEVVLIIDGVQIFPNQSRCNSTAYRIDNEFYFGNSRYQNAPFLNVDAANADNGKSVGGQGNVDAKAYAGSDGGIRWRHLKNRSANFLFCDGHAEPRALKAGGQTELLRRNVNVNIR